MATFYALYKYFKDYNSAQNELTNIDSAGRITLEELIKIHREYGSNLTDQQLEDIFAKFAGDDKKNV